MGYGGGGGGGGGSGGSGGSGTSGGSGYRSVGDDRTANLKVNNITSRDGTDGTEVDGIVEVNTTAHFIPPSGTTAERGSRGRGLFSGGADGPSTADVNIIEYVTISTLGNARDFGDLTNARRCQGGVCASSTRSVAIGGRDSPVNEVTIDYVTISATGNAFDFGDLTGGVANSGQCSNSTRGICFAGSRSNPSPALSSTISYITLASLGNASDFGNASVVLVTPGAAASPTRGLFAGGYSPAETNSIEYITIATTGNSEDFGDLTSTRRRVSGSGNSTRAIWAGGNRFPSSPNGVDNIDYVTIASLGDAIDFGNLTAGTGSAAPAATSSPIRSIIHRAYSNANPGNSIEYVTISTTGNASDFGDTVGTDVWARGGSSDSHGGLG